MTVLVTMPLPTSTMKGSQLRLKELQVKRLRARNFYDAQELDFQPLES